MGIWNVFKRLIKGIVLAGLILIAYANAALYRQTQAAGRADADVLPMLNHLEETIHTQQAAQQMQEIYPEGFVFMHALYGLSWCDALDQLPKDSITDTYIYRRGIREIDFAIAAIQSEEGRAPFYKDLPLRYGAFYRGWLAYLEGRRLKIKKDTALQSDFSKNCLEITQSTLDSQSPFIESYPGNAWPGDNVVGMAAVCLHNSLFQDSSLETLRLKCWNRMKGHLSHGMFPHSWSTVSNSASEAIRGSSQSLMLAFLPEIDSAFARQQFLMYKDKLKTSLCGLPCIREYPAGTTGGSDVDSGPLVMGIGSVASIVGIRTAAVCGDATLYLGLKCSIDALLLPVNYKQKRRYIGGQVPILDAFMCWSKAAPFDGNQIIYKQNWRLHFQLCSTLIAFLLIYLLRRYW